MISEAGCESVYDKVVYKMDPIRPIEEKIVKEKLAVFTFNDAMQEPSFRRYFIKNWYDLTVGMKNSTILFLGGVHGKKTGQFGGYVSFKTLTNQVRIFCDYLFIFLFLKL